MNVGEKDSVSGLLPVCKILSFHISLNGRLLVPLLSAAIWNSYFFSLDIIGRRFV